MGRHVKKLLRKSRVAGKARSHLLKHRHCQIGSDFGGGATDTPLAMLLQRSASSTARVAARNGQGIWVRPATSAAGGHVVGIPTASRRPIVSFLSWVELHLY